MSNKMRWRYGDTNPVVVSVDASTIIEIGDLLWLDANYAKPDALNTNGLGLSDRQTDFASKFLGVAMQQSRDGDVSDIRVATTGIFELDCDADTFELGDLIVCGGIGTDLLSQKTTATSDLNQSIARAAKQQTSNTTSILAAVESTIMTGGVKQRA